MSINPEKNPNIFVTSFQSHGDRIDVTHEGKTLKNIKKYSDEQGRFLFDMGERFKVFDVVVKLQDANGRVAYVNRRSLGDKFKRLQEQSNTASKNSVAQRISRAFKSLFSSLTYTNAAKDQAAEDFRAYRKPHEPPAEVKSTQQERTPEPNQAEPTDYLGDEAASEMAQLKFHQENNILVDKWMEGYENLTGETVRNKLKASSFPETPLFVYKRSEIEKFISTAENDLLKGIGKNGVPLQSEGLKKITQTANALIEEIKIAYRNKSISLDHANDLIRKLAQFNVNPQGKKLDATPPLIPLPKTAAEIISRENDFINTWKKNYDRAWDFLDRLIQNSPSKSITYSDISVIIDLVDKWPEILAGINEDGKVLSKENLELVESSCNKLAERLGILNDFYGVIRDLQPRLKSKVRLALINPPVFHNVPLNKGIDVTYRVSGVPYRIDSKEKRAKEKIDVFLTNFPEKYFEAKGQTLQEIILSQLSKEPSKVMEVIVNLKHLILVSPMQGYECLLRYIYSLPTIPPDLMNFLNSQNIDNLIKVMPRLENVEFQGKECDFPLKVIRAYIENNQEDERKVDLGYKMMAKLINEQKAGIQLGTPPFSENELEIIGSRYASLVSLDLVRTSSPLFNIIKKNNPEIAYGILFNQDLGQISWERLTELATGIVDLTADISDRQKALALKLINTGGRLINIPNNLVLALKDQITHLNLDEFFQADASAEHISHYLSQFPRIENLKISNDKLQSLPPAYRNLKVLDCRGCSALENLPSHMPNLTSLNISGCAKLVSINGNYPELVRLELGTAMKLSNISGLFPKLTDLDINQCHHMTNISGFFPSLSRLYWYNNLNMENISGIFAYRQNDGLSWQAPLEPSSNYSHLEAQVPYRAVVRGLFGNFQVRDGNIQSENAHQRGEMGTLLARGDLNIGALQAYIPFSNSAVVETIPQALANDVIAWIDAANKQMQAFAEYKTPQMEQKTLHYKLLELQSNIQKCQSDAIQRQLLDKFAKLPSLPDREAAVNVQLQKLMTQPSKERDRLKNLFESLSGSAQLQFIQSRNPPKDLFPISTISNPKNLFTIYKMRQWVLANIETIDNSQLRVALAYSSALVDYARINRDQQDYLLLIARAFGQKPPLEIDWDPPLGTEEITSISNDERFLDALPLDPKSATSSLKLLNKIKETNPSKAYALLSSSLEHADFSKLDIAPLLTFAREAVEGDDPSGPKLLARLMGSRPPQNAALDIILSSKELTALASEYELLQSLPLQINTPQYIGLLSKIKQTDPQKAYALLLDSLVHIEAEKIDLKAIIGEPETTVKMHPRQRPYYNVLVQMQKELSQEDFEKVVTGYLNKGNPLAHMTPFFSRGIPRALAQNVEKLNVADLSFANRENYSKFLGMFPKIKKQNQLLGKIELLPSPPETKTPPPLRHTTSTTSPPKITLDLNASVDPRPTSPLTPAPKSELPAAGPKREAKSEAKQSPTSSSSSTAEVIDNLAIGKDLYDKAKTLFDEQNPQAITVLLEAVASGSLEAMSQLGYVYETGKCGEAIDGKKAVKYYQMAANLGHPLSQIRLARCYEKGLGVPKDIEKEREWLTKANDQAPELTQKFLDRRMVAFSNYDRLKNQTTSTPNPLIPEIKESKQPSIPVVKSLASQVQALIGMTGVKAGVQLIRLGTLKEEIRKQQRLLLPNSSDFSTNQSLLSQIANAFTSKIENVQKEADAGDPLAQYALAMYSYENGDFTKAFTYATLAATVGKHPAAQNLVGVMVQKGEGTEKNAARALEWYQKATDNGTLPATPATAHFYFNMGLLLENGDIGVEKNLEAAKSNYLKAAEAGSALAQYHLYLMERGTGVTPLNPVEAEKWLIMAANNGHGGSQNDWALILQNRGNGFEARKYFELAANQGSIVGQFNLAALYAGTKLGSPNLTEALKWFEKAAAQGDQQAKDMVAKVKALIANP